MTVSEQNMRAIAHLAKDVRRQTPGAGPWDEPGILAAIRKVAHLSLAEVTAAAIRAAGDRELRTPGAIGNPSTSCWRPTAPPPVYAERPALEVCDDCSRPRHECERVAALGQDGAHPFVPKTPGSARLNQTTGELFSPPDTTQARAHARAELRKVTHA